MAATPGRRNWPGEGTASSAKLALGKLPEKKAIIESFNEFCVHEQIELKGFRYYNDAPLKWLNSKMAILSINYETN